MTRLAGLAALALAATGGAGLAHAEQPRVFFAPEDRPQIRTERLQVAQHGVHAVVLAPTASQAAADTPEVPRQAARLEGIALSRDGRAAAWIGGRRYEDGAHLAGLRLRVSRDGVRLVGADGEGPLLKVGQAVRGLWVTTGSAP
jgi:hypothetical protein